ncbi:MAG: polysaccharide deacetylase family protein [Beijerinckiaceae bacterium]|nr:polysaccharide deacetylase family protein [Beijerinckiaceae bacterium]
MRYEIFKFVLATLSATKLHYLMSPSARGLGAILMINHVRPWEERPFAPNRCFEITPEFLDRCLSVSKLRGYDLIALDDVPERLRDTASTRPFLAITVDGGYRDLVEFALPIFKRHKAPFTSFATPGFMQRTSMLWWVDLEMAIEKLGAITISGHDFRFEAVCNTPQEKQKAFTKLVRLLRKGPEAQLQRVVSELAQQAGVDTFANVNQLCMTSEEVKTLASEPLASIGAQTMTYPILAKHDYTFARREIGKSRQVLEDMLHRDVRHFSYPFGDRASASMRDFYLAASVGLESAVTKRPGVLFAEHAEYIYALPRLQLNGHFQNEGYFDVLLSGVPFALYNRGRKLNVL